MKCKNCGHREASYASSICVECLPAVERARRERKLKQMEAWRHKNRPSKKKEESK